MKVLVLGASGMLGNAMARVLPAEAGLEVYGVARRAFSPQDFPHLPAERYLTIADIHDLDALRALIGRTEPDVVINAVGMVKQLAGAEDPLVALPINALLPHQLARLCGEAGARLVHISTDCVFDGARGNYTEDDLPDATDLYGRSKLLGEVDYPHAVTLRTSIVGHEIDSHHGLFDWFLSQQGTVAGYRRAIFSGLTTVEFARVIARQVMPNPQLRGLYHVAGEPISKHDLLGIVAEAYGKRIEIVPRDEPRIDRSLSAARFRAATGYKPPGWRTLVRELRDAYDRRG
ncbi:SDR family oxidoreductase [Ancylobacter dichloromethanicus]|nr:SDR family oxidoreductase [Ancylobacter dichloromethanicus]MBS7556569.1 SDR family oxidoreductase [Ancylobacter dichloromethanicus]